MDAAWFLDPENGDFHLALDVASVVNQGSPLNEVTEDIDGQGRSDGEPDIGADEYF